MAYRIEITARAARNLRQIYTHIHARDSAQAQKWFNGLQAAIVSLDEHPGRSEVTPENSAVRHLLYGSRRDVYRVIYAIDEARKTVTVVHIRHGARSAM